MKAKKICKDMGKRNTLYGLLAQHYINDERLATKYLEECYYQMAEYPEKCIAVFGLEDYKTLQLFFKKNLTKTQKINRKELEMNSLNLTPKEIVVLKLICREKTTSEIAKALKVGISTVEAHKTNLYKKTRAKTIVGLVMLAIRNKIVEVKKN